MMLETKQRIQLDRNRRFCYVDEVKVHLTPTEYNILCCLMDSSPQVVSNLELRTRALKTIFLDPSVVKTNIYTLRKQLGSARSAIHTHYGVGYRFEEIGE